MSAPQPDDDANQTLEEREANWEGEGGAESADELEEAGLPADVDTAQAGSGGLPADAAQADSGDLPD